MLIALGRGDTRMIALLNRALVQGRSFRLPAGVVGQTWRDGCVPVALAQQLARACGELCGAANSPDIIDDSVVILATERRDPIVTSDPKDLLRLDPSAQVIPI